MNIVEALLAVSADVGAVPKGRKMQGSGSYKYRSIEQITPLVHAAFIAHGVMCVPQIQNATYRDGLGKNGNQSEAVVTVDYVFTALDGSELRARTQGEALDTSDKATNKAMTAAWKQALVQTLCIPLEDAGDPDHASPQRGRVEPVREPEPIPDGLIVQGDAKVQLVELVGRDRALEVWAAWQPEVQTYNGVPYVSAAYLARVMGDEMDAMQHEEAVDG